ncbi:M56 family metallopeptidase [Cyclobacterium jeungdonense]|uniref:M56 family metallopeptidase n=1 Tax=Cyclobacterium jeungdonense TaxID=708087 RepID=A0ABT8CFD8_9BACT|nr:M56 family metallopeptidase [Cyclobacterium jeungdonense]MDN3690391.1 M56 family metallopeptidase [Cyclobacterium jeungdonense]
MATIINYVWQSTFCLAFFYGLYWVFLKNEKTFLFNRFFLLVTPLLAILFPLVEIPVAFDKPSISLEDTAFLRAFEAGESTEIVGTFGLPEITVTGSKLPILWGITDYLLLGYLIVAMVLFCHLLWQYLQLRQLIEKGWYQTVYILKGNYFKVPTYGMAPVFSFFDKIFWEDNPQLQLQEKEQILEHELEHVRQRHTYDVLYYQVLSILFWFNPMIHLMRMALIDLHEYQADARVLQRTENKLSYAQLIARMAFKGLDLPLGSYFIRSTTLNRILMMKRPQKTNWLKLVMLLPLMAMLFGLVSMKTKEGVTLFNKINTRPVHLLKRQILAAQDSIQVGIKVKNIKNPLHYESIGVLEDQQLVAQLGELSYEFSGIRNEKDYFRVLELIESLRSNSTMVRQYGNAYTFATVENKPTPETGWDSWYDHLQQGLQPYQDELTPASGPVELEFIIDQEGALLHPVIRESFNSRVDQQLLDAVSSQDAPQWSPGSHNGKPVPVVVQAKLFISGKLETSRNEKKSNPDPVFPDLAIVSGGNGWNASTSSSLRVSNSEITSIESINDLKTGAITLGSAATKHLSQSLIYPSNDRKNATVGTSLIKITADRQGKVVNYQIIDPLSPEIQHMLLEVLKNIPALEPVHPKNEYLVLLPITFQLRGSDIPLPPSKKKMYGDEITVNGYGQQDSRKSKITELPALTKRVSLKIINKDYLTIDGFTLPLSIGLTNTIKSIIRSQEWDPDKIEVVFYASKGITMDIIQKVQEALRENGIRKLDYADPSQSEPLDATHDPLILIDGVVQKDNMTLSNTNPEDIESIQVMKGDQVNLFGEKAKNGVMRITTKNFYSQSKDK